MKCWVRACQEYSASARSKHISEFGRSSVPTSNFVRNRFEYSWMPANFVAVTATEPHFITQTRSILRSLGTPIERRCWFASHEAQTAKDRSKMVSPCWSSAPSVSQVVGATLLTMFGATHVIKNTVTHFSVPTIHIEKAGEPTSAIGSCQVVSALLGASRKLNATRFQCSRYFTNAVKL